MGDRHITATELPYVPRVWRNELVRGEVREVTPPGFRHALVAQRLAEILGAHVRQRRLGIYVGSELGFRVERDPDTVRAPDGAFLSTARLRVLGRPAGYLEGAPDLAVEIVSPGDAMTQVREKARMWLRAGARMVVVVEPQARIVQLHTRAGERLVAADGALSFGDVIPGLAIGLTDLFADA